MAAANLPMAVFAPQPVLPMAVFEPQPAFEYLASSALPDDMMLLWSTSYDGKVIAPPMFSAGVTEGKSGLSEEELKKAGTSKKKIKTSKKNGNGIMFGFFFSRKVRDTFTNSVIGDKSNFRPLLRSPPHCS